MVNGVVLISHDIFPIEGFWKLLLEDQDAFEFGILPFISCLIINKQNIVIEYIILVSIIPKH